MKPEVIEAYKKAGKIAKKAREYGKTLCVEGASALEIAEKVESKIKELGGSLAFPVDVSINAVAAHYSPVVGDKLRLKKGDLVKLDLGAHVDGYIGDTAVSVSVGESEENEELIAAAGAALASALSVLEPGVEHNKIGAAVSKSLPDGINIINNLRGHSLGRHQIHAGKNILNYENDDAEELKDIATAIEPFTTRGAGWVVDAQGSQVYRLLEKKPIRAGRKIMKFIDKKYKTLPFCLRQLVGKFGKVKAKLAVRQMLANKVIKEYPVLREKSKSKVAQAEHTVLILDDGVIVTT